MTSRLALSIDSRTWSNIMLAITSGAMLGVSFPPSPFYSAAYVALVPFLLLMERLTTYTQVIRYTYLTHLVFHAITLYWVGGFVHGRDSYMMISGAALLLIHPAFYWIVTVPYFFVRKHAGAGWGLVAFPLLWVAYDYSHALSEYSFPWITLGNSQAYDLYRAQIVAFGSVYGLSLLLVVFNVLAFVLLAQLATRAWKWTSRPAVGVAIVLTVLYLAPMFYGRMVVHKMEFPESEGRLKVGIIQPNIDPWEKWGQGDTPRWEAYQQQVRVLIDKSGSLGEAPHDLIVWPETAIPFAVLSSRFSSYWDHYKRELDSLGIPVYTGLPIAEYFDSTRAPITATRVGESNLFVDYYNGAVLIEPHKEVEKTYKKSILVPFAERVPYAETFSFLIEPLKWSVGISGWGKGEEQVVNRLMARSGREVPFSGMICYESVYPDYVRTFAKLGAQFLVIITNDSWWGNTSGAYQHAAYASFRAIETRRWIIRAANGGISGFVDPVGRMHQTTGLYSAATISGEIVPGETTTFYVRHGDLLAQVCAALAGALVFVAVVQRKRSKDAHGS